MKVLLVAVSFFLGALASNAGVARRQDLPYSTWMIQSIMGRKQGVVSSGAATSTLEAGILALALEAWLEQYPSDTLAPQISDYLDQILLGTLPSFPNATSTALLPLDRLTLGQALIARGSGSLTAAETMELATLNGSLAVQRRNPCGGFWYYVYPEWSYLDGTVSFLPFMALEPGWPATDMLNQISLLWSHCRHNASGLLVHGYDASRTAIWADPVTGASPLVWGRSLGWYLTGLVNAWQALTGVGGASGDKDSETLKSAIRSQMAELAPSLIRFADAATGAWWQMPTFPGRAGNYLESSSTALFTSALLKGARLGVVPAPEAARTTALRAYAYMLEGFVVRYPNATLGFNGTVSVCSLNSTATYEYYTTRPLQVNGLLGEAAFVMASLEVERL